MHPALPVGIALVVLPAFRAWLRHVSFIEWSTIEEALEPRLHAAGCKDLQLQPAEDQARLLIQRRVLGTWLPIELLILPVGLELGESIQLGLSLRDAKLLRPRGMRGWFVFWAARLWLLLQRTSLAELILHAVLTNLDVRVEGEVQWFSLDEVPPFSKLIEIRRKYRLPVLLDQLAVCRGIQPRANGVQFDIGAGPLIRTLIPILQRAI